MGQTAKLGKKESERAQHRLMKRRKKREVKNRKTETASEKRELRRRGGEREERTCMPQNTTLLGFFPADGDIVYLNLTEV